MTCIYACALFEKLSRGVFSFEELYDVQSKLFIWAHIYIIESIYIRDLSLLLFFAELNALPSARMNPE